MAHANDLVIKLQAHLLARHRTEAQKFRAIEAEMSARAKNHEDAERGMVTILRDDGLLAAVEARVAEITAGEPASSSTPRRGNEAVLALMQEKPRIWTARELHQELDRRGWINPDVAHPLRGTEAAINRLHRSGRIEKLARGRYRATL